MTDQEKNEIIAGALGLCWHEFKRYDKDDDPLEFPYCIECGVIGERENPDFSTPEGFFVIMERGPKRRWWNNFIPIVGTWIIQWYISENYIDPPVMRDTLSLWLSENEGEWREK